MGLKELLDLDWETLVRIHEEALEFYQQDKELTLTASIPSIADVSEKISYTAKELRALKEHG